MSPTRRLVLAGLTAASVLGGACAVDSARSYTWARRGHALADIVRVYCAQGTAAERATLDQAVAMSSQGARVTIACP